MNDIKTTDYLEDGIGTADVEKVLNSVGVQLKENETTYRNFENVLSDLAEKWNTLSDVQKNALGKTIAGVRQANVFLTLMSNMSRANELTATSLDSAGLAQERYNIYLESTEAKLNRLKTSMQELYTSLIDSGFINMFIDGTTGVLNFISALGGLPPLLATISGLMIVIKREQFATMLAKSFTFSTDGIKSFVSAITRIPNAFIQANRHGATFTQSLNASATAMSRMTSGVNGLLGTVGLLITVFSLYSMYQAKQKQKHEEYIASLKEKVSTSNDEINTIEELKIKYEELYNTTNRTQEQNKELLDTQEKLTKSLGLEKGAIDATKDSWDELSQSINNATNEKLKNLIEQQKDVVLETQKELQGEMNNNKVFGGGFSLGLIYEKNLEELKPKIKEILSSVNEEIGKDVGKYSSLAGNLDKFEIKLNNISDVEEYYEYLKLIREESQKEGNEVFRNSKSYSLISAELQRIETLKEKLSQENNVVLEAEFKLNAPDIMKQLGISDIEKATEEQLNQMKVKVEDALFSETDTTRAKVITELLSRINDQLDLIKLDNNGIVSREDVNNVESLKSALSSINTDSLSSDNADLLANSLKTLKDGGKLTYEQFSKLMNLFPNLSTLFAECGDSTIDFGGALDYVRGMIDDYGSDIDELDSAIEKVSKGQSLSGDEIVELTRKYPQLQAKIDETTGLYYIELDALKKTKEQTTTTAKGQIKNEIDKTKVTLENTKKRIEAYLQERIELQKLSNDGYTLYSDALKGVKFNEDGSVEDSGALTYLMSQDSKLREEFEKYSESQKRILDLQKEYDNLDIIGQEGSSEKKNKDKSYIEEGFQDRLDLIKAMREELVNEISKLQSQIEIATSKHGDASPYVQNLRDQLNKLKEDESNLIKSSAEELRKLRDDYFKRLTNGNSLFEGLTAETFSETDLAKASRQMEKTIADLGDSEKANGLELNKSRIEEMGEAILSISEELNTLGDDFYSNKKEKLDEYISRIQDAISYEEELYSDKDNEAQLRFSILDETDDGYINTVISIQQDLIDAKLKLQETYKSKYENLLKQGLSAESSVMRELKTKWNDTNKEIFDMRKEMNEKFISYMNSKSSSVTASRDKVVEMLRKQDDLQKDIYDKQKDAIKEKADADKEALENRKKELDAIKSEYDYQNKIADLRRALADTLSDLNALEFDDSADAIQAKVELANQLQDDKQALADEEFNHAIEMAQEAIDKAIDAIEKQSNAQTEAIDRLIDALSNKTDKEYTNQANNMLLNDEEGTYKKLLEYNREWGDGIDNTITSLFDSAKPVLEEIRNANIGIQEALNNFANLAYSKQLENQNNGTMTFDDKAITGNGQIVSPDMISKSLNNVFVPVFDGLKNVLATFNQTPKAITLSPQFNVYADGNVDNATLSEAQKWFLTVGMKTLENGLEKYLIPRSRNIVGTTK